VSPTALLFWFYGLLRCLLPGKEAHIRQSLYPAPRRNHRRGQPEQAHAAAIGSCYRCPPLDVAHISSHRLNVGTEYGKRRRTSLVDHAPLAEKVFAIADGHCCIAGKAIAV